MFPRVCFGNHVRREKKCRRRYVDELSFKTNQGAGGTTQILGVGEYSGV